ncbi:MAG: DUF2802 domain-containing protein [Woeseiaceae bacterium]
MSNDYFSLYFLLACNVWLLAVAVVAIIRFDRRWQRIESFWDSPTGVALDEASDDDLREQMQATRRLEQRLGELQSSIKRIDIKAPELRPPVERDLPIENAVRMARLGASVDDLTRNCGLNVGEARLMRKLHGREPVAASGN